MTQRDLEIISMVYAYEGCGIEHIRQLFFQGAALRSIPCYRRLAYLVKQGYLQSVKLPALNKHFLTPGAKARSLLSCLLKGAAAKRIRIESPLLMLHKLAICDVRAAVELATKDASLFLVTDWVNESTLRQSPLLATDPETEKQILLIPDAAFTLISQTTGRRADFYLEMDLATVSLKALRHRIRGYLLRRDDPSPVLFVVPDSKRQTAIAAVALDEATRLKANSTAVWITQKECMTPETVLSAPWLVVGHAQPVTLQGLAAPVMKETAVVFAGTGGQLG
jgi:Replication-relaxation